MKGSTALIEKCLQTHVAQRPLRIFADPENSPLRSAILEVIEARPDLVACSNIDNSSLAEGRLSNKVPTAEACAASGPSFWSEYHGTRTKVLAALIVVLGITTWIAYCNEDSSDTPSQIQQP